MISLMVNGKPKQLDLSLDLAAYLDSFGLDLTHVAVGYNGEVLAKEQFSDITLRDGDVLEIVRPVGGG